MKGGTGIDRAMDRSATWSLVGENEGTITVMTCVGLFAALATPCLRTFKSNVVDVVGNLWQDE